MALLAGESTSVLWNVHNHGITQDEMNKIDKFFTRDIERAQAEPLKFTITAGGDWNFPALGEGHLRLEKPSEVITDEEVAKLVKEKVSKRALQGRWNKHLLRLIELEQKSPTHYTEDGELFSRIDRIYCSLPAWAMISVCNRCHAYSNPKEIYKLGISDHSPVIYAASRCKQLPKNDQPIKKETFQLPGFKEHHDMLAAEVQLEKLPTIARW